MKKMKSFLNVFSLISVLTGLSAGPAFAQADSNIFINLSKKLVPSVVNISSYTVVKGPMPGAPEDFFRKFFEDWMNRGGGRRGEGGGEEDEGEGPPMPPQPKPHAAPRSMS